MPLQAQTTTEKTLYSFTGGDDGSVPAAVLAQGVNGSFYGATAGGGANSEGVVFQITPSGTISTVYPFTATTGSFVLSGVVQGGDGNFYGTSGLGGLGVGNVYQVTPAGVGTNLYSFTDGADGGVPATSLIEGSDGNFYGTTIGGGTGGDGVVFKVTPSGTESALASFSGLNGSTLYGGVVQGSDGNFYGTTASGGVNGNGTVFQLTPAGALTTIYNFVGTTDGSAPQTALVEGSDGNYYGTTSTGGTSNKGTVYKVSSAGALTTLYSFTGVNDGSSPNGNLILGSDGNFYGITEGAGSTGQGTIFKITPGGTFTLLYTFLGNTTDGGFPQAGLIQGDDGNLYGTTTDGGADSVGTIFNLTFSPALAAPVQLSLSSTSISAGSPVTLSWQVLNAFSTTAQQCYAFVQGSATGAGAWAGAQAGTLSKGIYAGHVTITPTAGGTYTYVLTCGGLESGYATLTVAGKPISTTTVTASPNPAGIGQNVTLQATVAGTGTTPTGTVKFVYDGITLASSKLTSGIANFTASTIGLPPGSYAVTAEYSGDTNYAASNSSPVTVQLTKADTTTTLSVSPTTVTPPAAVSLTATVAKTQGSGIPAGTVTFSYSTLVLGTATLNNSGVATLNASSSGVPAGSYGVVAKYNGNTNNAASSSAPVTVTVK